MSPAILWTSTPLPRTKELFQRPIPRFLTNDCAQEKCSGIQRLQPLPLSALLEKKIYIQIVMMAKSRKTELLSEWSLPVVKSVVRRLGKSSGAFAFPCPFWLLFVARQKVTRAFDMRKADGPAATFIF